MKKLLVLLLALSGLAGCNTESFTDEEARCVAYKDTIKDDIAYRTSIAAPPSPDHYYIFELEDVFFSEQLKTCVYVEGQGLYDGPVNAATDYIVKDFYNNKELETFSIKTNREFTGELAEFETYIEGIKGGN